MQKRRPQVNMGMGAKVEWQAGACALAARVLRSIAIDQLASEMDAIIEKAFPVDATVVATQL